MIKFNDDNIYVGYIKELLHSFNLPMCKVKKDNSKFTVGELYLDKELEQVRRVTAVDSFNITASERVCDYKFNDEILNITKHLEIRNTYYDSYTHNYLGNYLRFLRDYLDLNLMQMYNCFSNESPANLNINVRDIRITEDEVCYQVTSNGDFNIFMISVKPDTTYTLSLEYLNVFNMFCGFYSNNKYIEMRDTPPDSVNSLEAKTFKTIGRGCTFNNPVTIHIPALDTEEEIRQESNLKLFICLPNTYIDNIVILEGDYTKNTQLILTPNGERLANAFFEHRPGAVYQQDGYWWFDAINTEKVDTLEVTSCEYIPDSQRFFITFSDDSTWTSPIVSMIGNYDYTTRNQLMEFQTHVKYLLADRLVEYLSENVISHVDEIVANIKRVQILLAAYDPDFKDGQYGKWSKDINKWIYKYISTHGNSGDLTYRDIYRDTLCYIDKDIESVLMGIKKSIVEKEVKSDREKKALKVLDALGGVYA